MSRRTFGRSSSSMSSILNGLVVEVLGTARLWVPSPTKSKTQEGQKDQNKAAKADQNQSDRWFWSDSVPMRGKHARLSRRWWRLIAICSIAVSFAECDAHHMLNVAQGNQLAALLEEQPQHLFPKEKKKKASERRRSSTDRGDICRTIH